jgi:YidC/Oxa1 family membrane protein insertase
MLTVLAANPLQPLIDFSEAILKFFHDNAGFGWGAAIIAMTVVIRLLILPLTFKGVRGMQEMQRIQPEIKRVQERYKDDKQRQQQEMMKMWQEHGVNPLSSCMPLLLQIPFFMALFYLLRGDEFKADIEGEESFLFIDNLAESVTGDPGVLVAMIALYVGSMLGSSAVTAISADRNQRIIMFALPVVFTPIVIGFPAGLLVYWITTNFWTIGQQLFVKKFLPPPEPVSPGAKEGGDAAHAATPVGQKHAEEPGEPAPKRFSLLGALRGEPAGDGAGERAGAATKAGDRGGARTKARAGAAAGRGSGEDRGRGGNGRPDRAPPPSPRKKKKKRSGRRR